MLNFIDIGKNNYEIEIFFNGVRSSIQEIVQDKNWYNNVSYIFQISSFLRLGNSIIQLLTAIHLAEQYKAKILLPKHNFLNFQEYEIDFTENTKKSWLVKLKGLFFGSAGLESTKYELSTSRKLEILRQKIWNFFPYVEDTKITQNTLVIHIRSGDIFSQKNVHPLYVQPPLSFYEKIIEYGSYRDIVVVTESDRLNPCIKELLHRYDARVQTGSLQEDTSTIFSAKNLVIGQGTFGEILAMISPNLKNLYRPFFQNYNKDVLFQEFENFPYKTTFLRLPFYIFPSNLDSAYEFQGWKNTPEQRKYMLFYPKSMIELISAPYPPINLALNKPATQSSQYISGKYNADGAVNGIKNGKFGFHTSLEKDPWWQVDLEEFYKVTEIKVYNRLDACSERSNKLTILISLDSVNWQQVYAYDNKQSFGGINGFPLTVQINKVIRYVKLQLKDYNYFHLDEVEVYGFQTNLTKMLKKMKKLPIYLHLGCGNIDHSEFINIDIRPASHIDYVHHIDDLSIFVDKSVDLIYASHCLEHFSHLKVPHILKEWYRVLKINGILRLAVPDFDLIIKRYYEHSNKIESILGRLMGGQDYQFNYHKTIFNQESLEHLLKVVGFREVRKWQHGSTNLTNFPDASRDPVSLNIEAIK